MYFGIVYFANLVTFFIFFSRQEECANRPRGEFTPKTLGDLNIDGLIGVGEGGINGGRFFPPNSNINRVNKTNNKSNHNIYSSQQNLSKSNSNNNGSSFTRNRQYGSQQSLSTNRSNNNNNNLLSNSKSSNHGYNSNNTNNNNHSNLMASDNSTNLADDWLNAWNIPTPQITAPPPTTATIISTHSSRQFTNHNSKNYNFNDPWTGDFLVFICLFFLSFYNFS